MGSLIVDMNSVMLGLMMGLPRLLACLTMLPFLSRDMLPGLIRNGVAISLSLVVLPALVGEHPPGELSALAILGLLGKEVVIGILFGYLVSIVFWTVEGVGFFIDNQRGATMASSLDPLTGSQSSPLAQFLTQGYAAAFFSTGLFLVMLHGLYGSFRIWPVYSFVPHLEPGFPDLFLGELDRLMRGIFVFAAPVIAVMFLIEFGLAIVGRFAPQLNVFFLAMGLKSAGALFCMILYLAVLFGYFGEQIDFAGMLGRLTEVVR